MAKITKQIARRKTTKKRVTVKSAIERITVKSAIDRIEPMGFDEDEGIKLSIYGQSGTGKTRTWSTFPKPILAMIVSGGLRPGELRSIDTPENRKSIKCINLLNSTEIQELAAHQAETETFQTLVLDHATGLQDLVLREILGLESLPAQMSWGLATQQQYGQCTLKTKECLRSLLSLACNIVIVAGEREFNTESDEELIKPTIGSALTPSLVGWLNYAADYVCQNFIQRLKVEERVKIRGKTVTREVAGEDVGYYLRTRPNGVHSIKFRVPPGRECPVAIQNPTYAKMRKMIKGVML